MPIHEATEATEPGAARLDCRRTGETGMQEIDVRARTSPAAGPRQSGRSSGDPTAGDPGEPRDERDTDDDRADAAGRDARGDGPGGHWSPRLVRAAGLGLAYVVATLTIALVAPARDAHLVIGVSSGGADALAVVACLWAGTRGRGPERRWRLFTAAALAAAAVNAAMAAANGPSAIAPNSGPRAADFAPLATVALVLPALFAFPTGPPHERAAVEAELRGDSHGRYLTVLLDALIVVGAVVILAWSWALRPVLHTDGSGARWTLNLAGLAGQVLAITIVVLVVVFREPRNRTAWALLGAGLTAYIASSGAVAYTAATIVTVPAAGRPLSPLAFGGFLLAPALIALAALVPNRPVARRRRPPVRARPLADWGYSFLPYVFLVGTGISMVAHLARHKALDGFEITVGLTMVALVLVRQLFTVTDNTRLVFRVREGQLRLRHQAFHDPLTGLANRALFAERLEHAVAGRRRDGRAIALLFLDLDDFKTVNDSLGHDAGDVLLLAVADRLRGCTRDGDTVARLGGDEFAVLLETGDVDPPVVGQRIVDTMHAPFRVRGHSRTVGASVGLVVAEPADRDADPETLLRHADVAMYAAKARGKGALVAFGPHLDSELLGLDLHTGLALALAGDPGGGELDVRYQPIVDLADGRVEAMEALARWTHPHRGQVPADTFVPVAERAGLVGVLDNLMLDRACRFLARLRRIDPDAPVMHVNVSATRVSGDALVPAVEAALARHGVPPEALVVEITETGLIPDLDAAARVLGRLTDSGVRIALDDVGAGHTALAALRLLPIHILKLDQALAADAAVDPRSAALRHGLLSMARELDLVVVAEGIENRAQRDAARDAGCRLGQGHWLAVPGAAGPDGLLPPPT